MVHFEIVGDLTVMDHRVGKRYNVNGGITLKTFNRPHMICLPMLCMVILLSVVDFAQAADEDNCLMCHRHRFVGRIDENGKRWNYHVDEFMFNHSLHRNIKCRDCHTNITRIPHDPVTQPVGCASQCHIKPPFAQKKFSHENIVTVYNKSAHGVQSSDPDLLRRSKPHCKYCHLNPIYSDMTEQQHVGKSPLQRCRNCHLQQGVSQAFKHITHRLRRKTTRNPQEIVKLCAKCHADTKMMSGLNVSKKARAAVESYNRSIHGKLVRLGSQKAADCISCHASNALHDIYKKEDPKATIAEANIAETCKQCHEQSNDIFVKIAVHPDVNHKDNTVIHSLNIMMRFALYGTILGLVGLMALETRGRRRHGIKYLLRDGTSWRKK